MPPQRSTSHVTSADAVNTFAVPPPREFSPQLRELWLVILADLLEFMIHRVRRGGDLVFQVLDYQRFEFVHF